MMTRAVFCRCCGEKLCEVCVLIHPEYDPQTGIMGPDRQRRWDCPRGTRDSSMGHDGGHSSPDAEILDTVSQGSPVENNSSHGGKPMSEYCNLASKRSLISGAGPGAERIKVGGTSEQLRHALDEHDLGTGVVHCGCVVMDYRFYPCKGHRGHV